MVANLKAIQCITYGALTEPNIFTTSKVFRRKIHAPPAHDSLDAIGKSALITSNLFAKHQLVFQVVKSMFSLDQVAENRQIPKSPRSA